MISFNPISIFMDSRRVTRGTPEMLAARQQERLNELVKFARANSRLYAEKYRGLPENITDVRLLPPVTKVELMEHFDDVITDPSVRKADVMKYISDLSNIGKSFMGKYMVWTTSGTTGTPGIFLEDKNWDAVITAVNVLRMGGEWYTGKVIRGMMKAGGNSASVFAGNGHFLGVTMLERQRSSNHSRGKRIRLVPVTLPIAEIVKQLNEFQPAMFAGYSSALGLLAQEQLEGRLNIHPSIVISSAEPLSDENRALIQQAFGVPPRNNYGCSEGGVMGYECNHSRMHINADWIIFEPVDANHDPVPVGQLSDRTLITNLANRVMPIIRYELGDRVTLLPEKCDCGITLPLIKVEGRTDEILRFKSPSGGLIPVLPLALWSVVKETPGVLRFQAIQTSPDELKIRLEAKHAEDNGSVWKRVYVNARDYLTQQGLDNVSILRAEEPPMRDPKSGKFRNVWAEKSAPRD
ncbi:MAG: phenylacetate--CoA ligase family protein [Anaerolineales bacterium]|nr:phenylacetate--CoA ligase family protein [Anaerolineales bacterium]